MSNGRIFDNLDSHTMNDVRRAYYKEVEDLAQDAIEEASKIAAETPNAEGADPCEQIADMVDSHEFIIYTYKARYVCLASKNDNAEEEMTGECGDRAETQAYWAMYMDVLEAIERIQNSEGRGAAE